jgi:hypothetical protein
MNESPDTRRAGLGASGADNTALDDEAKAFNQGKGRMLAAMIATLLAVVGGAGWYLAQDQPEPYGELGKQINGLRTQYFDGFLVCALPGKQVAEIKSDGELRDEFHSRAAAGARYATHLRGKCSTTLRELHTRLRALMPPAKAAPLVTAMADSARKMTAGVDTYAAHLESLPAAYDKAAAQPEIESLVRGWYEFRKSHGDFNRLIRQELGR